MKTGIYLSLFILVSAFCGCDKDDDDSTAPTPPAPQTRYEMLTSHYWRVSNYTMTAMIDTNGDSVWDTTYTTSSGPDSCSADDKYYFKTNGFWTADLGAVTCGLPNDSIPWSLVNGDTEILMDSISYGIQSISSSQLILEESIATLPMTLEFTMTYVYP